jgi:hypothetical protein
MVGPSIPLFLEYLQRLYSILVVWHGGRVISKPFRSVLSLWVVAGVLLLDACIPTSSITPTPIQITSTSVPITMTPAQNTTELAASPTPATDTLYEQPLDPNGKLLLSSWRDPDGSDYDEYVWEDFTLPSEREISEIHWYGVYDPLKFGKGGPVLDFHVSIYPSIPAGTEPAVAGKPLLEYQIGGNAGETATGTVGTATLYGYTFTLPASFPASAGEKYWIQIEASQEGSLPDWCLAAGAGGDARHYWKGSGAGGDILYRSVPGDAAFSLR